MYRSARHDRDNPTMESFMKRDPSWSTSRYDLVDDDIQSAVGFAKLKARAPEIITTLRLRAARARQAGDDLYARHRRNRARRDHRVIFSQPHGERYRCRAVPLDGERRPSGGVASKHEQRQLLRELLLDLRGDGDRHLDRSWIVTVLSLRLCAVRIAELCGQRIDLLLQNRLQLRRRILVEQPLQPIPACA